MQKLSLVCEQPVAKAYVWFTQKQVYIPRSVYRRVQYNSARTS